MAEGKRGPLPSDGFRAQAEARLREAWTRATPDGSEEPDTKRLVYELQVYQLELEMQNEELKRSRRELDEARLLYEDVFEFAPVGYLTLDEEGSVLRMNLTGAALLGASRDALEGRRLALFLAETSRLAFGDFLAEVLAGKHAQPLDVVALREGTDPAILRLRGTAGGPGATGRITMTDVTERKRGEDALRKSEEKYRWIVDSIHDGVWTIDRETRTTFANGRMCEMLGYAPDEMLGKPLFSFMTAEARADAERNLERRKQGIAEEHDFRFLRKDGSEVWTMLSTHPLLSPDGQFEGAFATVTDISSRKAAEEALRTSGDRFRKLTEELERLVEERTADLSKNRRLLDETSHLSQVGGWEVDLRTGELTWTDVTYEIHEVEKGLRQSVEQAIDYYAPESRPRMNEVWGRAVTTGEPFDEELEVITATGRRKWIRSIGRVDFEDGKAVRVHGLFQDIQIHRERLAALQEANKELESFSYSVSHDLRAPVRAIDGFAKLLEEHAAGSLDEEGRRLLATVRKNSLRMGHLIDDLLAYARARRGEIRCAELDMGTLVSEILPEVLPGEQRGTVDVRVGELPPAMGDRALVRQVLLNLLLNAVKFSSPKAKPVVEVGSSRTDGGVEYFVRDNGVGFDQRYVGKLFGVFQRLHSEREFPGTGIGLSLVRRIVGRHGGQVRAEGVVGEGATFYFTLGPAATGPDLKARG